MCSVSELALYGISFAINGRGKPLAVIGDVSRLFEGERPILKPPRRAACNRHDRSIPMYFFHSSLRQGLLAACRALTLVALSCLMQVVPWAHRFGGLNFAAGLDRTACRPGLY